MVVSSIATNKMGRLRKFVTNCLDIPTTTIETANNFGSNNIEISEANFIFRVPNFDKDKVTLSPTAYVRNLPWKIWVKVNEADEDGTKISISVFVICDYNVNNNWSCDASISFSLLSSNSSKNHRMSFVHCFNRNDCVKGFDPFIVWSDLIDPQNGYIENNKIVFEVVMKCDEPRCVPWNSKKHTRFVGLENKIENSFLNSMIQILYSIQSFRTSIEGLSSDHAMPSVVWEMQRIFHQLNFCETPVSIDPFIKSVGAYSTSETHDSEYFFNFLNKLLRKLSSTKEASDLFQGQISTLSTSTRNFEITEFKTFYGLKIEICENGDIDELLGAYFISNTNCVKESSTNWIDVSTLYRWLYGFIRCINPIRDDYGTRLRIENKTEVTQLPSILILHLDRQPDSSHFTIEQQQQQRKELKFCSNINLSKFVKKHVDSSSGKYVLHAVLVGGDAFSAFINVNNEIGWLKFDNDIVSKSTEKEAIEDNFRSVQMLVYLRCSKKSSNNANDNSTVQLKCIICMEATSSDIFSTVCGHIFCGSCIKMEFSLRQKCPVCQMPLTEAGIHPIYI